VWSWLVRCYVLGCICGEFCFYCVKKFHRQKVYGLWNTVIQSEGSIICIVIQQAWCYHPCAIYLPAAEPLAVVQFRFRGTSIWHTSEESQSYWVACILISGCLSLSIRKQEVSREFTESVVTSRRPTSLHGHLIRLACQATLPHQVQYKNSCRYCSRKPRSLYHWKLVDNVELKSPPVGIWYHYSRSTLTSHFLKMLHFLVHRLAWFS
jgi:hypothetical protein